MKELHDTNDLNDLLKTKKMYLFDFDGTLANTEPLHCQSYNKCLEKYGVTITSEHFVRYVGKQELNIYKMIKSDFNIEFDDTEFLNERTSFYLGLVKTEKLAPYAYCQELVKNNGVQFNILTSNRLPVINAVLNIWRMNNTFKNVVSAATNNIDKADVINDISNYFGFKKDEIVLFEDANAYLKLAQENGILSIGVKNHYNIDSLTDCDYIWSTI